MAEPRAEPFPAEGLPLEEARARVLAALLPDPAMETLPLAACLGRVMAQSVLASEAVPGFRAAILDGYAVADAMPPEPGCRWRVVGRSAAGTPYPQPMGEGEAVRILTGAPLPEGAARVLAQEQVEVQGEWLLLTEAVGPEPWIRAADEEAAPGQVLVQAGQRLGPADLGRLAGCGVAMLPVAARPRIGLLISGDELVQAGADRGPGEIWESNGTLLEALFARLGYPLTLRLQVADRPERLAAAFDQLAAGCDLVVSTGGVSAGDSDWIRPLLAERGTVAFWKLFLRPGRPFAFGTLAGLPFFGLPGNPVAAAITALQLVLPALQALEGGDAVGLRRLRVRLAAPLRRRPGRPELARARLAFAADGLPLALLEGSQASSRIGSLQGAELLLELPAEAATLEAGTELWAQLLLLPLF
jgi:molybdopterin molybdotransferase